MTNDATATDAAPGAPPIALDPARVRRILVCQLRQIGDVLLSTPAIHLLRGRFPGAEIHLLTEAKAVPVVQGNPDIARIHAVDRKAHRDPRAQLAFYLDVARNRYDLLVDFQQLPRIRWVLALARLFPPRGGRQVRLSCRAPWYNRWLYTHTVRPQDGYAAMSKASVLRPLGIHWNGEAPRMHLAPGELAGADAILAEHGIGPEHVLITVDPTHRRDTRRWPAEHFGRLAALAAAGNPALRFLVLHGPGELPEARAVAEAAGTPACVVTRRMLTLREMAACIARAALHVGNCSAPRHIAVAVGTPTLTILGSTSSAWTFPGPNHADLRLGLDCQPCNENTCPLGQARCLTDLEPETVLPALMARLRAGKGDAAPCA
jgi:heptosyltransferase-2/heptosyltransferase-3